MTGAQADPTQAPAARWYAMYLLRVLWALPWVFVSLALLVFALPW